MQPQRTSHKDFSRRRRWKRIKTNGVVALTRSESPIVFLSYDLSEGGVSFLYTGQAEINVNELYMDILVFDILMDFEYYFSHIKGRVKDQQLVADSRSIAPVWRYHVEFLELDKSKISFLQSFCNATEHPHFFKD